MAAQQRACLTGDASACGVGVVAADGAIADPIRTPEVTATLVLSYEYPLANGSLFANVNARYFKDHPRGTANADFSFTDDQTLVSASLGYRTADGRWMVSAQCSNCTDESYVVSTVGPFAWINDPMTWSIKVRRTFGV